MGVAAWVCSSHALHAMVLRRARPRSHTHTHTLSNSQQDHTCNPWRESWRLHLCIELFTCFCSSGQEGENIYLFIYLCLYFYFFPTRLAPPVMWRSARARGRLSRRLFLFNFCPVCCRLSHTQEKHTTRRG